MSSIVSLVSTTRRAFVALALISVVLRLVLLLNYAPMSFPDTAGYEKLAWQIRQLDFGDYDGARTPLYPLMLLALGLDYEIVWLVQSALGSAISLMLFYICVGQTKSVRLAFLVALAHSASLNLLFFEANVLSETLSTFLLICSLLLISQLCKRESSRIPWYAGIGVTVALAGMARPLLFFIVPLYFAFLALRPISSTVPPSKRAICLLSFIAPVIVTAAGWSLFNKVTVNYFGPTTLLGYNLTQHSGAFMQLAPYPDREIADVYLRYRQEQTDEFGSHSMTIWSAYPEMQRLTGMSFSELSTRLAAMSIGMFIRHPTLYLRSVFEGWVSYWKVPNYWRPEAIRTLAVSSALGAVWRVEKRILIGVNAIFLCLVAFSILKSFADRRWSTTLFEMLIIAIVVLASVLQASMEYGENARYSIPTQPLVLYTVAVSAWHTLVIARSRRPMCKKSLSLRGLPGSLP